MKSLVRSVDRIARRRSESWFGELSGKLATLLVLFATPLMPLAQANGMTLNSQPLNGEIPLGAGAMPTVFVREFPFVVFVDANGDLLFADTPALDSDVLPITTVGGLAAPDLFVSPTGLISIACHQSDQVVLVDSGLGGGFNLPEALDLGFVTSQVAVAMGPGSLRRFAWVRDDNGTPEVVALTENGVPEPLAVGDQLAFDTNELGQSIVAYVRNGQLFVRTDFGSGYEAEFGIAPNPNPVEGLDAQISLDGAIHLAYSRGGDVFYFRKLFGEVGEAPQNISNSLAASTSPKIRVQGVGIYIIYQEENDLIQAGLTGSTLFISENLTQTPSDPELDFDFEVDGGGFTHLVYQNSSGEVIYRNNVTPPVALVGADPLFGEVPLEVQFTDESAGVATSRLWDFGDGTTSTAKNPLHVYRSTGLYTVTLSLVGQGGQSTQTVVDFIEVVDPFNQMSVQSVGVPEAGLDIVIPVSIINTTPLLGFMARIEWDCSQLAVHGFTTDLSDTARLAPEFVAENIDPVNCIAQLTVALETSVPFDGVTIPTSVNNFRLANIVADVVGPPGLTQITLADSQTFLNAFSTGPSAILPELIPGEIEIVSGADLSRSAFVRGDVENNGSVSIADAINVLNFLFVGGSIFNCEDAADVNDDGGLNISDAVYLLNYLFVSGSVIPYPFPSPGYDPTTSDSFTDCD